MMTMSMRMRRTRMMRGVMMVMTMMLMITRVSQWYNASHEPDSGKVRGS